MSVPSEPIVDALATVLERSRSLGLLGTGPIDEQVAHARSFLAELSSARSVLDLGSGGGVPGLVIAAARPDLDLVLLDAQERRCAFLRWAVTQLGVDTCRVVEGRAELIGRGPLRGSFDAVVARSFGRPALTAECGGAFLRVGGRLIVSEPPAASTGVRWPEQGLLALGQIPASRTDYGVATLQIISQAAVLPDEFPRSFKAMRAAPAFV